MIASIIFGIIVKSVVSGSLTCATAKCGAITLAKTVGIQAFAELAGHIAQRAFEDAAKDAKDSKDP